MGPKVSRGQKTAMWSANEHAEMLGTTWWGVLKLHGRGVGNIIADAISRWERTLFQPGCALLARACTGVSRSWGQQLSIHVPKSRQRVCGRDSTQLRGKFRDLDLVFRRLIRKSGLSTGGTIGGRTNSGSHQMFVAW